MITLNIRTYKRQTRYEPVMRNGKPTARTRKIEECVEVFEPTQVEEITIQGKTYYVAAEESKYSKIVYKEDGTALMGLYKYGRTGTKLHSYAVGWSKGQMVHLTNGMNGATTHGWGARFIKFEE